MIRWTWRCTRTHTHTLPCTDKDGGELVLEVGRSAKELGEDGTIADRGVRKTAAEAYDGNSVGHIETGNRD